MPSYYSGWESVEWSCSKCGWTGRGKELAYIDFFEYLTEMGCPKCGERITIITEPTVEESRRNWDKVSELDKCVVEISERQHAAFEKRKLYSPQQLPDIVHPELTIDWDIESREGGDTILRFRDLVLWREPAFYEGYERFIQVADILLLKYGPRLQDLVPTPQSELFLYGDRCTSITLVEACRQRIRAQATHT